MKCLVFLKVQCSQFIVFQLESGLGDMLCHELTTAYIFHRQDQTAWIVTPIYKYTCMLDHSLTLLRGQMVILVVPKAPLRISHNFTKTWLSFYLLSSYRGCSSKQTLGLSSLVANGIIKKSSQSLMFFYYTIQYFNKKETWNVRWRWTNELYCIM